MKLALWRKLAAAYLRPELPAGWRADGWVLHAPYREWFAPALIIALSTGGRTFSVNAISQFLAVPRDNWSGDSLQAIEGVVWWDSPTTFDDAAPVMTQVSAFVRQRALPFLDRSATGDGQLAYLRQRAANIATALGEDLAWQDVNLDEEFCYAHLIAGDRAEAVRYAEYAGRTAEVDPRSWAGATRQRVARVMADPGGGIGLLREYADHTRAALRVPS